MPLEESDTQDSGRRAQPTAAQQKSPARTRAHRIARRGAQRAKEPTGSPIRPARRPNSTKQRSKIQIQDHTPPSSSPSSKTKKTSAITHTPPRHPPTSAPPPGRSFFFLPPQPVRGNFLQRLLPLQPVHGNFLQRWDPPFPHQESQDLPQALGCRLNARSSSPWPCLLGSTTRPRYHVSSLRPPLECTVCLL